MDIQLILLALLLIIGTYELVTLNIRPKSEKNMSLFWKKSLKHLGVFEKGLKNTNPQKFKITEYISNT
jgi:hypothetical protein